MQHKSLRAGVRGPPPGVVGNQRLFANSSSVMVMGGSERTPSGQSPPPPSFMLIQVYVQQEFTLRFVQHVHFTQYNSGIKQHMTAVTPGDNVSFFIRGLCEPVILVYAGHHFVVLLFWGGIASKHLSF